MEINEKKENVIAGIAGALIGGIIGGAVIVLIGQLGLISAISGVVLAFCTLKGYELLGGKMSRAGILASIIVMLIVPYLADRISWALVIVDEFEWAFGDAFLYVHEVVEEFGLQANYWKDLLFVYLFTALGAFTSLQQTLKKQKSENEKPPVDVLN